MITLEQLILLITLTLTACNQSDKQEKSNKQNFNDKSEMQFNCIPPTNYTPAPGKRDPKSDNLVSEIFSSVFFSHS